jgi:hypothetical protein
MTIVSLNRLIIIINTRAHSVSKGEFLRANFRDNPGGIPAYTALREIPLSQTKPLVLSNEKTKGFVIVELHIRQQIRESLSINAFLMAIGQTGLSSSSASSSSSSSYSS